MCSLKYVGENIQLQHHSMNHSRPHRVQAGLHAAAEAFQSENKTLR